MESLKVGYFSTHNCFDRKPWSGIIFSMYHALSQKGVDFYNFGTHCRKPNNSVLHRFLGKVSQKINYKDEAQTQNIFCQKLAKTVHEQLQNVKCDLIFAPVASQELYYLFKQGNIDTPVLYLSDVPFTALDKLYKPNLSLKQKEQANRYEAVSLSKSHTVIYPTDWAAKLAVKDYDIDNNKVSVIPYGANITSIPAPNSWEKKLSSDCCRLLFIGVNWQRKGGDLVVATLQELERKGIKAELYILGSDPILENKKDNIHIFPFLDKNIKTDREKFSEILTNSHFLMLPTRADTFGIVNCEANAYGIPVISSKVGGVVDVIKDGVNGYTLPIDSSVADYADIISQYFTPSGINTQLYERLAISSRHEFDTRLNWNAWADSMVKEMKALVN